MAEYKTTVALEIGAQSVIMGVFTPAGKGFALSRYGRRDIVLDPVEEGMRMDYVSHAVAELVAELKVKGSEVRNVVSGQQVFMRFIKLPALDSADIAEQVGFEAQQHIPFPLEDITYSYQELGERDGEMEVLLVAIKREVLDELNTQVEGSGLRTKSVDCSTTSLYNSYCVSYPEETESVMILDIGAKTTEIIFSEAGRFFTRSVTAAGSFITNAIAREFRMSFRDAEQLKLEKGSVSLGNGHTDSMLEQDAELATTIRTAMGRMSSEIQRTINHYRAQYQGSAPVKAYICGGGARLPYAVEFLNTALGIPVEYLNPLRAFSIGNKIDEEALTMDALCLGPLAGAAVAGAKAAAFDIDLVPTSVGKDRAEKELIPKVIAAGVIALACAGFYAWAGYSANKSADSALKTFSREQANVSQIVDKVEVAEERYADSLSRIQEVTELFSHRNEIIDVIKQINDDSPSVNYWFSEFTPLVNYNVDANDLNGSTEMKASVRLIDMARSRGTDKNSSINNQLEESADYEGRQITAIYLAGYIFKGDSTDNRHQDVLRDLIRNKFSGKISDSLFNVDVDKFIDKQIVYLRFLSNADTKSNPTVPGYLERFMLVLPLKTPISLTPEKN